MEFEEKSLWESEKVDVCGREGREAVMVSVGVRGEKGVKNIVVR